MAKEKPLQQAQITFDTLCKALDENDWYYTKDEEKLSIECGAQGDDLPMEITVTVDAERMLVILLSHMPFKIPEEKRVELAVAVSIVNSKLIDGNFDYDVRTGHMVFRMTSCFLESLIGTEVFTYMLFCSCRIIDEYNDKFLMFVKGLITIDKFLASGDKS